MERTDLLNVILFLAVLNAQPSKDLPIRGVLKQPHVSILRRTEVAPNLDLVLAMGSPQPLSGPMIWWGEKQSLGLFLQDAAHVYTLAVTPGFPDCFVRILRATATDTVIQCTGEKSTQNPNQKFVYDIRAKNLIKHFSYQPFSMRRVVSKAGNRALFIGTDQTRQIAVEYPGFRLLNYTEAQPAEARQPPVPKPLPKPDYAQFAKARPGRVKDGYKPPVEFDDHIGPWTMEGVKLWFGKTFYDGEGTTGIGGFGYFDTAEEKYYLYAPPEIVNYSVSVIHVDPETVWLALVHNGEWGGSSGGLLRFDRRSRAYRKFEMPEIGLQFTKSDGKLLLATNAGFAVISDEQITSYFVDKTTDGRLKVSEEL